VTGDDRPDGYQLERAGRTHRRHPGPLLGYQGFTAFLLEATFFDVMLLGRDRVPPWFYFLSCCMVSLGTADGAGPGFQPAAASPPAGP